METEFKCNYCGKIYNNPIPHKCIGGFRKHHLKFTLLNPTTKDKIKIYKRKLCIPRNIDLIDMVQYIIEKFDISVTPIWSDTSSNGFWVARVLTRPDKSGNVKTLTPGWKEFNNYRDALEYGVMCALESVYKERNPNQKETICG